MNIIMMGAQGTGKGTVAGFLKDELNIPHISTGEIFRKNIKEGTELGKIATKYADEGKLVPDEVTNEMVKNRLGEADCENGFILDGYPRNLAQAEELDKILSEKGKKVDLVVNLSTPTDEIIEKGTVEVENSSENKESQKDAIQRIDGDTEKCNDACIKLFTFIIRPVFDGIISINASPIANNFFILFFSFHIFRDC